MAYDFLIKNGRVVDGSGGPSFRADVAVKDGKIVEIGKLSGPADRTVDAAGLVVAPGFIDNHCHYDAQVTWDPLCSYSCDHGATSVIFGNCSLSLAPVRKGKQRRLSEFLSYVEAIPMEVLDTLEITWETVPEYLDQMDRNLGVNVGNFIGHTAVRYYVMGDDCQSRTATDDEIRQMQDLVRGGMKAGALGLSVSRNQGHFDPQGVHIPAIWADEKEIFALGDVLRELGTGLIQSGGGAAAEMKDALMSRLSEATGRTVVYNNLGQTMRRPGQWQAHMAQVDATTAKGIRAFPMCTPNRITDYFTMRNTQTFRGLPVWHPICLSSPEEMLKSCADPEVRRKLHDEAVEFKSGPAIGICSTWWDYMVLQNAVLRIRGSRARRSARSPRRRARGSSTASSILPSRSISTPNGCTARTMSTRPRSRRSSTIRTPSSASRMAGRTSNSRAVSASRPASSPSGCATSRSCRWRPRCAG